MKRILTAVLLYLVACQCAAQGDHAAYTHLQELCKALRLLERTTLPNGVPDYRSQTIKSTQQKLLQYKNQLATIDTAGWATPQQVDYMLLLAEMNALDFNCRILKPWVRDPAFYAIVFADQSDTPDHEGPTSFAAVEIWQYAFPLAAADEAKLTKELAVIPALYQQATANLTGNARDLWEAGTEDVKNQLTVLDALEQKTASNGAALKAAIAAAKKATATLVAWLEKELPKKNGPSGIGKADYNWFLHHVLMEDFSWEDEVTLLKRELARAYTSLQLEKEHNRQLPELTAYATPAEFAAQTELGLKKMMAFIKDRHVMPVKEYMEPAVRSHTAPYVEADKRNFFDNISYRAPGVLYSHATHWFEIARLKLEPSANLLRAKALPYNMWMQRSEGLATAMEEIFMHAGLWDDNPRARELVWIMLAQRCARGLASLYAHANMINFAQARKFQVEWTPKRWTGNENLVGFEQQLYLRQPGYGTSYVSGKYFIEQLMMDMGRKQGNDFKLYDFFESFYNVGILPVSLVRWELTGNGEEVRKVAGGK